MKERAMSRRAMLETGVCALAAAAAVPRIASAQPAAGLSPQNEATVRKFYAAWETKEWRPFDILLADNFTFTSPNNDDHISKSAYKTRCWESQVDFIEHFDLQRVIGSGNDAFVKYVCRVKNGKTFQNVEYVRVRGEQVESIECYFGAQSNFASAVGSGQN